VHYRASKIKFTGKEYDDDFGLNWVWADRRPYMPDIGRWAVMDPILNDLRPQTTKKLLRENYFSFSPFQYVRNNPVIRIDSDGRFDTKFHVQLTQRAFQNRGYSRDAGVVASRGNAHIDRASNFFNNNQHGMRNLFQTRGEAVAANQKFINTTLELAVAVAGKDPGKALNLVGQAQHTQQDIVRHDYFSMQDHLLDEGGKNIALDKNPPESELETAQLGSEDLIKQFEKAVQDRYGDAAAGILNSLRNYELPESERKNKEE